MNRRRRRYLDVPHGDRWGIADRLRPDEPPTTMLFRTREEARRYARALNAGTKRPETVAAKGGRSER